MGTLQMGSWGNRGRIKYNKCLCKLPPFHKKNFFNLFWPWHILSVFYNSPVHTGRRRWRGEFEGDGMQESRK